MTLDDAIKALDEKEEFLFRPTDLGKTVYAAVIEHPKKKNAYAIEIGYNLGTRTLFDFIGQKRQEIIESNEIGEETKAILLKVHDNYYGRNEILKNFGDRSLSPLEIANFLKTSMINDLFDQLFPDQYSGISREDRIPNVVGLGRFLNCNEESDELNESLTILEHGVSISSNKNGHRAGTLGAIIQLNNSSRIYGLTNTHVIYRSEISKKKNYVQHPGKKDTGDYRTGRIIGKVVWQSKYKDSLDAAIFRIYPHEIPFSTPDYFLIDRICDNPIEPQFKLGVQKCGRTSRRTEGEILSIKASIRISDSPDAQIFRDQIMTSQMACPGDSGSVLFSKEGNPLGLIFAKTDDSKRTFANKWSSIFKKEKPFRTWQDNIEIDFNSFYKPKIENMNIVTVTIPDQKLEYLLIQDKDGGSKLRVKFSAWENNLAKEIEIVENSFKDLEIIQVDGVRQSSCKFPGDMCNDLQIKYIDRNATPVGERFEINNRCNFNRTQVSIIYYNEDEYQKEEYKKIKCADCYKERQIPETSKGNILVGKQ